MPVLGQFPTRIHLIDTSTVKWTAGPAYQDPNFPDYAIRDTTATAVIGGVDHRTTTTETIGAADQTQLVTLSNSGAIAVTLDSTVPNYFFCAVMNIGTGTATLTPSSGMIEFDGALHASIALVTGQTAVLYFDGTNWYAYVVTNGILQVNQGGTGLGSLTAHAVILGEGTAAVGFATIGTAGRVLTDNGASSDPSFQTPAAAGLATPSGVQQESYTYSADTGAANAYVAALTPAIASYVAGQYVAIKIAHANTGASTLDAGGGAVAIKKWSSGSLVDPASGDLPVGFILLVKHDGTQWQALNISTAGAGSGTPFGETVSFGTTSSGTLTHTPNPTSFFMLFRNGVLQQGGGVDYTLSGTGITLVLAGFTTDIFQARYMY